MATDTKAAAYAALASEAELAVAAVKDPELRRVAFEKILTTLIEEKAPSRGGSHSTRDTNTRTKGPAASAGTKSQSGPKHYIEELISESFFKDQRTIAEVKAELANRGRHIALTSLSGPLQKLTQERRLRRQKTTANGKGSKTTYAYSNW